MRTERADTQPEWSIRDHYRGGVSVVQTLTAFQASLAAEGSTKLLAAAKAAIAKAGASVPASLDSSVLVAVEGEGAHPLSFFFRPYEGLEIEDTPLGDEAVLNDRTAFELGVRRVARRSRTVDARLEGDRFFPMGGKRAVWHVELGDWQPPQEGWLIDGDFVPAASLPARFELRHAVAGEALVLDARG